MSSSLALSSIPLDPRTIQDTLLSCHILLTIALFLLQYTSPALKKQVRIRSPLIVLPQYVEEHLEFKIHLQNNVKLQENVYEQVHYQISFKQCLLSLGDFPMHSPSGQPNDHNSNFINKLPAGVGSSAAIDYWRLVLIIG